MRICNIFFSGVGWILGQEDSIVRQVNDERGGKEESQPWEGHSSSLNPYPFLTSLTSVLFASNQRRKVEQREHRILEFG